VKNSWLDLKYAWRLLRKSWGYSLICASVIALSVGLSVWTYSLMYSQLLKPLGFPGSERWSSVQIGAKAGAEALPAVDAYTYQQMLQQNRSADYLGAFAHRGVILSEGQASRPLRAAAMTPRLFAATQVTPLLGRTLQEADAQAGATQVAVLTYDTWQAYFAGDRGIIGKTTRIDSALVQVIGVMPRDFFAFEDFELFLPLQTPPLARPSDSAVILTPIIVLGEGKELEPIRKEMQAAIEGVNRAYPDLYNSGRHVELIPALQMYTHAEKPIIAMLALMSLAVLILGCVNISMVFLARLLERSRELALRVALGSSRGRLLRQCLIETALIVALGLAVGYGLAWLGVRWTQGISEFVSRVQALGRDPNLVVLRPVDFVAAVVCAAAVWLLSTLIPAWRIANQDAAVALAAGGKGSSIRGGSKSVRLLVGLQVLVSCVALVVCGNVILAVDKEVSKPSGLTTAQVTITTEPTTFDSRYAQPSERLRYWDELQSAIKGKIGGAEVAFTAGVPTRPVPLPVAIETQQGTANQGKLTLPTTVVSEDYFKLLGVSLRSGRLFDSTDNAASLNAAIVDENMAARYWPGQNVVGQRVRLNPSENGPWLTIVGVVSAVTNGPFRPPDGVLYRPLRQAVPPEFRLLVKSPGGGEIRETLRAAAFSVDRDLPLRNLQTLDDYMGALNVLATAMIPAMTVVALITALLAASGLFGLINRSVAQRTQEVGIRRALGATPWQATSMFLRQGAAYLFVALMAVALGVMALPALSASIRNILDRAVVGTTVVVLLMATVIFLASYLPSRRAVALEPGDALRHE
jgi:putative ABC transport system permease protein